MSKRIFIEKGPAKRKGRTSTGSDFTKGTTVVRISSSRGTGEVFTLLPSDLRKIAKLKPQPLMSKFARKGR